MITISRRQARRLRAVFRRHALGFTHKGAAPPLIFVPDPDVGLRVRHHQPHLAVECVVRCVQGSQEPLALPLDALADLEGSEDSPVVLEATDSPGQVRARWEDRGIPQTASTRCSSRAFGPRFPNRPLAGNRAPRARWTHWPRRRRPRMTARRVTLSVACNSRACRVMSWPPMAARS